MHEFAGFSVFYPVFLGILTCGGNSGACTECSRAGPGCEWERVPSVLAWGFITCWLLVGRLQEAESSRSLKMRVATTIPPPKYYLQLGFNILRLHSYKVPLVKGQRCAAQNLEMVRKKSQ